MGTHMTWTCHVTESEVGNTFPIPSISWESCQFPQFDWEID